MFTSRRRNIGTETGSDLRSIGADDASAEHENVRRRNAGHAAQQDAAPHLRAFEILRPFLNAHAPGDFTHRRKQRQRASVVSQSFRRRRR